MRIYPKKRPQFDWSKWHAWFAWHPVTTKSGIFVWLEWIERSVEAYYGGGADCVVDRRYRLPSER